MGLLKGIYFGLIHSSFTFTTCYMTKMFTVGRDSKKMDTFIDILVLGNLFVGFHYGYTDKYLLKYFT